jgi:hypothetical protein
VRIEDGVCHVFFAYDVGLGINLDEVQRLIGAGGQRKVVPHRRRTPGHFGFARPPLRIIDRAAPLPLTLHPGTAEGTRWATASQVECLLFDFGAISVMYTIPLRPPGVTATDLGELVPLSSSLYENAALLGDSRRRVEELLAQVRAGVKRPSISPLVEDYAVYHLTRVSASSDGGAGSVPPDAPHTLLARAPLLAALLRSEPGPLSPQEIEDAVACRISYTPNDLTLIDWNSALVLGEEMEDVLAVLEYANLELLELRQLDEELDRALERSRSIERPRWWRRTLGLGPELGDAPFRRIAELQVDAAVLFEEVNNSLKMLGDQYLARVYRLASQRLHLGEWDATILRKLDTLENLYDKMHDFQANRRMELLEWIIILLIAFEIVMSFVRH